MKFQLVLLFALALTAYAQDETTTDVNPPTTTEAAPTPTENPGLPFGSYCNGLIARCNRYSNTVVCVQRRDDPTTPAPTTALPTDAPSTEDPVITTEVNNPFLPQAPLDVCQTGGAAILGRCQCQRNCKDGVYVEDGMFDEDRQICVGLVGSLCTILVPNCVPNGRCNFIRSRCECNAGHREQDRVCVPNV